MVLSGSLANSWAVMALLTIPSTVIWSYSAGGVVLALGLVTIFLRGDWQMARGFDKLILFGPLFYAAPLATFGTEHFTLTAAIASIVPKWIPWHLFWAYLVGACFIAAALSLVTRIQPRPSGAGCQPHRAVPRARHAHPCDDCAIFRCHSRAVLQHRAIQARRSRSRRSAAAADSPVRLRTRHLDVSGGSGLRSHRHHVARWQENPRSRDVDWLDRALRGVGRLCPDRNSGTRQPRQWP